MALDDDSLLEVLQFLSRYDVERSRLVASVFQRQILRNDDLWPREMLFLESMVPSEPAADHTTSTDDNDVYDEEQVQFSCTDLIYEIRGMRLSGRPYSAKKRAKCASFNGTRVVLADHSEFCVRCWPETAEHVLSVCKGARPEEITQVIGALANADRYFLNGFLSAHFVTTFLASETARSARFVYVNCDFERADDDDRDCDDAILKYVLDEKGKAGRRATFFKVNATSGLVQRLINAYILLDSTDRFADVELCFSATNLGLICSAFETSPCAVVTPQEDETSRRIFLTSNQHGAGVLRMVAVEDSLGFQTLTFRHFTHGSTLRDLLHS